MRISTTELVGAINKLKKDRSYQYVNPRTKTHIRLIEVSMPEGPITIRRFNPSEGEGPDDGKETSLSTQMIARIAHALKPNIPVNFDRVLGGSYNTRSALEALIAHTPQFYTCKPGRVDSYSGEEKRGHKHLIWVPDDPHKSGVIEERETNIVISEVAPLDLPYDGLLVPPDLVEEGMDIDVKRQHSRIQIALVLIGQQLGFNSWVAKNDQAIKYNDIRLGQMESVISSPDSIEVLSGFSSASTAIEYIDCVWFSNSVYMPAVMEIEHSTGVKSGLVRMKGLKQKLGAFETRYVVVAPDDERQRVTKIVNDSQFADLNAGFFPYSHVEELLSLARKHKLVGVTRDFVYSFIESV